MQPVTEQLGAFFLLVVLGNAAGVIFDAYRFIRQARRLKKWETNLCDAVFWLIITALTYVLLLFCTTGEVRFYVFIAMALGLCFYLRFFSFFVRRAMPRLWRLIGVLFFWKFIAGFFSFLIKVLRNTAKY
ncbi:MAG: spore cortex biosynthesis protein YabQ [Peptococcaceae bacterium]|nr:hypothetical protein [Peptococcaceae bacterium]MDH7526071.1 spore cortex biosynthesis protein YabQ [Peptococcaceae bacterium]